MFQTEYYLQPTTGVVWELIDEEEHEDSGGGYWILVLRSLADASSHIEIDNRDLFPQDWKLLSEMEVLAWVSTGGRK